MLSNTQTSWSVNRSHLVPAAQLLASLYPGLISIRIKEKDYYNRGRVSIRISVKARSAAIGRKVHANIYAHHLDHAIARIINHIDAWPELRKTARS